jgi:hypothetical protein
VELPDVEFEVKPALVRRLRFLEEIKKEFWEKWVKRVWSANGCQAHWRNLERDVKEGDVVLLKDETIVGGKFRLARINQVKTGGDGHVRTVEATYKNPGEEVFRTSWRPIHKIVVLVPFGYEARERGEGGGEGGGL